MKKFIIAALALPLAASAQFRNYGQEAVDAMEKGAQQRQARESVELQRQSVNLQRQSVDNQRVVQQLLDDRKRLVNQLEDSQKELSKTKEKLEKAKKKLAKKGISDDEE